MTLAILGFGSSFRRVEEDGYTQIGNLREIVPPAVTAAVVDTTHMGSEERFAEAMSGLRDGGSVELSILYTPEGYEALLADYLTDEPISYQALTPHTCMWAFNGFVTLLDVGLPLDETAMIEATIKVTGKPEFAVLDELLHYFLSEYTPDFAALMSDTIDTAVNVTFPEIGAL